MCLGGGGKETYAWDFICKPLGFALLSRTNSFGVQQQVDDLLCGLFIFS